jgi:HAMP domain-containing protein
MVCCALEKISLESVLRESLLYATGRCVPQPVEAAMVFALLDNVRMRPKLLALFLFTATIPLLLVGGTGCYFAIQTLSRQTATNLTSLQDMQADKISWAFRQLHALLQAQAANPSIRQALTKEAPESIRPHLATTARTFGLHGLALVTQTGLIHASTIQDLEGKSLTFGELAASPLSTAWSQSREATAPVFVDFTLAPLGGTLPLAFMALPVGGADGTRLGVLVAMVAPDFVNQALSSRLGLGKTGETYAFRHIPEGGDRYEFRSSLQTMGAGAYAPGVTLARPPAYWRDAVERGSGFGEYTDSAGTIVYVAFRPVDIVGTRWFLVSKIDKAEMLQPVVSFVLAMLGVAALLVISITPGVHFLARRLSHPLEAGVRFAQDISSGNLAARWHLVQHDEMGELAHALNRMAQDLRDQDWRRRGISGLDNVLRGEHTPEEILRRALHFLVQHTGSHLGLAYLAEENGVLSLRSSYAFQDRSGDLSRVEPGHGLVGQAVREGHLLVFHGTHQHAPMFHAGTHEAPPISWPSPSFSKTKPKAPSCWAWKRNPRASCAIFSPKPPKTWPSFSTPPCPARPLTISCARPKANKKNCAGPTRNSKLRPGPCGSPKPNSRPSTKNSR